MSDELLRQLERQSQELAALRTELTHLRADLRSWHDKLERVNVELYGNGSGQGLVAKVHTLWWIVSFVGTVASATAGALAHQIFSP